MLEPRDRQLLFDALRPPDGFRFDQGVGTTYSLDLLALVGDSADGFPGIARWGAIH